MVLTVDVHKGGEIRTCGCKKSTKCGHSCECKDFCADISIEKVRDMMYACKEYISQYGNYVNDINNWGYSPHRFCFLRVGKISSYAKILEKFYVSLLHGDKSCLCGSDVASIIQKALKVLPLSCTGARSSDYLKVDKSSMDSWVINNPTCVSFEKWERAVVKREFTFDISITKEPFEVAFYAEIAGYRSGECDIVAAFEVVKQKSCDIKYAFESKNNLQECFVHLTSSDISNCEIEYNTLVSSIDNCKVEFNTYLSLVKCGIDENVIANIMKCNISASVNDNGIYITLGSGKTISVNDFDVEILEEILRKK